MTQAQLTQALASIKPENIFAFFLVLARVALFLVAPAFSSTMLLPRVKSVIAVALALGMTPLAMHAQTVPTSFLPVVGLLIENFLVGLGLAFAISCVFAAIQGAGALADAMGGFSFGQMVDPINGNPGGAMTNIYTMVGLVMFLAIGGDAWTLRGLSLTFTAIPIGDSFRPRPLISAVESASASVLLGAVEIAAPVILAIMITDIALGMISKVVPQVNVFAVGFTVKVGVTLLIVGVSLPFMGGWMSNQLETSLFSTLHGLRIG